MSESPDPIEVKAAGCTWLFLLVIAGAVWGAGFTLMRIADALETIAKATGK